jgi:hypothetical protein
MVVRNCQADFAGRVIQVKKMCFRKESLGTIFLEKGIGYRKFDAKFRVNGLLPGKIYF